MPYAELLVLVKTKSDDRLEDGDILRKVGDRDVRETGELLEEIGMHRPGSVVELTFERDKKLIKIKMKVEESEY